MNVFMCGLRQNPLLYMVSFEVLTLSSVVDILWCVRGRSSWLSRKHRDSASRQSPRGRSWKATKWPSSKNGS